MTLVTWTNILNVQLLGSEIKMKGIVHPIMKILSSFPHPRVSFLCWTKKKTFWRMLVIKQLMVPIDLHSISFPTTEVNGVPTTVWFKILQISYFVFATKWGWASDDNIFIFGWTNPLKWLYNVINGMVHTKIRILSLFTYLHTVQNPYDLLFIFILFLFCEAQKKIF